MPPLVSVVVPVYDVAAYLPDCLASIARQPLVDHEVIVVDDGSPDDCALIVEEAARMDPRIRLHRQTNRGLGAARNVGVGLARGEFLAFADSDDVLPPDAWGPMLASLRRSGADFAVGRAERDDGNRRWTTPLMERNHRDDLQGVNVRAVPLVLADVFAWNKLFRRSFWDRAGVAFPEGTRYEDQPAMTRAFLQARSFDVLTETVYWWRVREDRSSITQKRHEIADLRDRVETKRTSTALVHEYADAEVTHVFHAEVLPIDMWEYFRAVPGCHAGYWELLVEVVRELWHPGTVPFEQTAVPPQQRLMGWFVAQDRRPDLERLLSWIDKNRPLPFDGDLLDHPWRSEADVPAFGKGAGR